MDHVNNWLKYKQPVNRVYVSEIRGFSKTIPFDVCIGDKAFLKSYLWI